MKREIVFKDKFPTDYVIDGVIFLNGINNMLLPKKIRENQEVLEAFHKAISHFNNELEIRYGPNRYSIGKYEILFNVFEEEQYIDVAFCPKIKTSVQGVAFEIADRGIWSNGPGIQYFIDIKELEILKTIYMR